jgi:hypothetical protein
MAAVAPTITDISRNGDGSLIKVVWNGINATNNTASPIRFTEWADRSVQFNGTFNNVTMTFEGSNEEGGAGTYFVLTDPQGNAISKTAAGGEAVTEISQYAKPVATSVGVATDITVSAVLRRANPMRT